MNFIIQSFLKSTFLFSARSQNLYIEYFMYETRGMALNIESNNINDTIPYGLEHYESDLKSAIATAKTSSFSSAFFDAITALGVTVDTSQF